MSKDRLTAGALLTYVAWLRGINVGGNSMIAMAPLVQVFEELGVRDVRSYINSGNVIFDAPAEPGTKLSARIESAIERRFALRPMVVLSTAPEMQTLVAEIERLPVGDLPVRVNVIFLAPGIDDAGIIDRLPMDPGVDDVTYIPGALVWRTPGGGARPESNDAADRDAYLQADDSARGEHSYEGRRDHEPARAWPGVTRALS